MYVWTEYTNSYTFTYTYKLNILNLANFIDGRKKKPKTNNRQYDNGNSQRTNAHTHTKPVNHLNLLYILFNVLSALSLSLHIFSFTYVCVCVFLLLFYLLCAITFHWEPMWTGSTLILPKMKKNNTYYLKGFWRKKFPHFYIFFICCNFISIGISKRMNKHVFIYIFIGSNKFQKKMKKTSITMG